MGTCHDGGTTYRATHSTQYYLIGSNVFLFAWTHCMSPNWPPFTHSDGLDPSILQCLVTFLLFHTLVDSMKSKPTLLLWNGLRPIVFVDRTMFVVDIVGPILLFPSLLWVGFANLSPVFGRNVRRRIRVFLQFIHSSVPNHE